MLDLFSDNVVRLAHQLFHLVLQPGDTAVDATCGNGKDCVILARILQGQGSLVAYDIQPEALRRAKVLFQKDLSNEQQQIIQLKLCSHEYLSEQGAKLFHYNLGYLPKGDKQVTTLVTSTISSIKCALELVASGGMVSVICYPGHPEGGRELSAVEHLASALPSQDWLVTTYYVVNRLKSPRLFVFRKR